ncbi:hypothetical protein MSAN_02134700 [Mycena sanguinolenta]|uniref:Uncharacterized protein n=1 Tax=Mycena sanguinolenta TaxID=230812 RepID=A0A8H6XGB6_9AGAR|nr:hypothetical protein MSAN_02134700 [Mycena sanguinolenta]
MDDHSQPEPEFTHLSAGDPESSSAASRHASGMFSHSQKFTVTGGTFSNITNNSYTTTPSLPSDFRMIPLADIDLRHEIRLDNSMGAAYSRPRERARVRRLYSAKVEGRKSTLTVAMYQGDDAEQVRGIFLSGSLRLNCVGMAERSCKIHVHAARFLILTLSFLSIRTSRHPNIVQIYGAASSNGIHTTLFNDDLTPLQEVLNCYRNSPVLTVYIYACCNRDFWKVYSYLGFEPISFSSYCTKWIRRSTGRLCVDLTQDNGVWVSIAQLEFPDLLGIHAISALHTEANDIVMDSLTLDQYHQTCWIHLRQHRHFDLSASTTVNPGVVFRCSSDPLEDPVEIAFLPSAEAVHLGNWMTLEGGTGEVMPNGWTRFQSGDVFNNTLSILLYLYPRSNCEAWLSQANHIFHCLNITSNFEDYGTASWSRMTKISMLISIRIAIQPIQTTTSQNMGPPRLAMIPARPMPSPLYPSIDGKSTDLDVEAESLHSEKDAHDAAGENCESDPTEILNCANHNASQLTLEEDMVAEEIFVPSPTFRIMLCIQLMLISFLALSGVHRHVW